MVNPAANYNTSAIRQGNALQDSGSNPNIVFLQINISGSNANGRIYLKTGTSNYWGIDISGNTLSAYYGSGSISILTSSFKKDCWYTVLLGVDKDNNQSIIRVWERDNPNNVWRYQTGSGSSAAWHFEAAVYNGTLRLDSYSEGRLYNLTEIVYGTQAFPMGEAPKEGAGSNYYTGLGINWVYPSTEKNFDFNGDSQFIGTKSKYDYIDYEQGGTQYGNITRHIRSWWNGSDWEDYTTNRMIYNTTKNSTKYLVSIPSYINEFKCVDSFNSTCFASVQYPPASHLIKQTLFYYDGSHDFFAAPSGGILTAKKELLFWGDPNNYSNPRYHYSEYGYTDGWGNQTKVVEHANDQGQNDFPTSGGQTITTTYDSAYHTYPISSTNALGYTTQWSYSYTAAAPISETGPNG